MTQHGEYYAKLFISIRNIKQLSCPKLLIMLRSSRTNTPYFYKITLVGRKGLIQALPSAFILQCLTHVLSHGYVLLQIFDEELDYRIQIHKVPYHLHLEKTHIHTNILFGSRIELEDTDTQSAISLTLRGDTLLDIQSTLTTNNHISHNH